MTKKGVIREMIDILKKQGESIITIAEKMGMDKSQFDNRLYNTRGQEFSLEDLIRLQQLSGTNLLAQFCLPEGQVIVKEPSAAECDIVELATIIIEAQASHGELHTCIQVALSDDRLTRDEQVGIDEKKKAYIANLERQLKALKIVYGEE